MKLEQLNLVNFRGFEQIELKFEPDVNVIAGVNGVGKSGLLVTLANLFSRALPEFTASTAKPIPFTAEDIQEGKDQLEVSAIFSVDDLACHMGVVRQRRFEEAGDLWNSFWRKTTSAQSAPARPFRELLSDRVLTGHIDAGKLESQQRLAELLGRSSQPLVIYFSSKRQLPGRPRSLPEPRPFELANAYGFSLQDREVELREFMHWFRVVEAGMLGSSARGERILDELRRVVSTFMPEFSDLRIEDTPSLRFVVEKNGLPLALNQLSDGERGLLAMIFDITRRLSIANPGLEDPIAQGQAIVLIDEIDLHLHPQWQREVLRRLKETFKACQFIVTTHSPQVLGETESRCVRFLRREKGRVIAWTPPRALGLDSSRVLEELMRVKARNAQIDAELHKLFKHIDAEALDKAEALITKLKMKLGENDPDLNRARALIAFLEGGDEGDQKGA